MRWVVCFGQTFSTWTTNHRLAVVLYIHCYLFLEDPSSGFFINRWEIGVELPATRKYFFKKLRDPNQVAIFGGLYFSGSFSKALIAPVICESYHVIVQYDAHALPHMCVHPLPCA